MSMLISTMQKKYKDRFDREVKEIRQKYILEYLKEVAENWSEYCDVHGGENLETEEEFEEGDIEERIEYLLKYVKYQYLFE